MGYVTDYTISVLFGGDKLNLDSPYNQPLSMDLHKLCSKHFVLGTNLIQWRSRQPDMRDLSTKYPHLLFVLDMRGEAADDWVREYYQDGRMQVEKAEVIIGDFDPSLLK